MDLKTLLNKKEFVLLDGAMGTMIQKSGAVYDHSPETLNITRPELIRSFHRAYIEAGADIVYANTFGANAYKLGESGYSVQEIIAAAVENAKKAAEGTDALVALDIGPIGMLLEPAGSLRFDEAYDYFCEQIEAGQGADLIVFETMTDLYELKAAVLAAKEHSDLPVIATMLHRPALDRQGKRRLARPEQQRIRHSARPLCRMRHRIAALRREAHRRLLRHDAGIYRRDKSGAYR